jgi:magnesium transporter
MISYLHRAAKTRLKHLDAYKKGSWVYVEDPTIEETERLVNEFKLDGGHVSDALDPEEMPRLEREGDQLYFFTRFPYMSDELHLETAPILFVLSQDSLITVSTKLLPRYAKFTDEKIDFTTLAPDQLLLIILNEIVEQYDAYLSQIGRQIKSIRSRLRSQEINNNDFIDFVLVEDELNEFLSALTPTNAILRRILINKHIKLTDDDKDLIEDLLLANEQSIEAAKSNNKSIVNIREAYSTIMSNNLNRVMRILTVVTVLLSIMTVVAGLYGMNIALPFGHYEQAFSIVTGGSIVVVAVLLWLFRRSRWL